MKLFSCLFILAIVVGITSCTSKTKQQSTTQAEDTLQQNVEQTTKIIDQNTEEVYESGRLNYKIAHNERYGFSIQIPVLFKAIDKSNNGDGYFIDCNNENVDMRIFGESITPNQQADVSDCKDADPFLFSDGHKGIFCFNTTEINVFYTTKDSRITLYIEAEKIWIEQNKQLIDQIAKSITVAKIPA